MNHSKVSRIVCDAAILIIYVQPTCRALVGQRSDGLHRPTTSVSSEDQIMDSLPDTSQSENRSRPLLAATSSTTHPPSAPISQRPMTASSSQGSKRRTSRSQRQHNFVGCMIRLARRKAVDSRGGSDGTLRLSADETQTLANIASRLNTSQSRRSSRPRGAQHRS